MDSSRAAMVIAYHHIRDRYNQLRAEHNRLKKIANTQVCCHMQPARSGIGTCLSQGSERFAKSTHSTSSGIASVSFSNQPSVREKHDIEKERECARDDVHDLDILSICQRLECLAASRVDVSNSLLDIAVQLRNVAGRSSLTTDHAAIGENRTGRENGIVCLTDCPELPLVSSASDVSDVVNQVDGSCTHNTSTAYATKEEWTSNGDVDVMNLDDDLFLDAITIHEKQATAQLEDLRDLHSRLQRQHTSLKKLLERDVELKGGDSGDQSLGSDGTWSMLSN